MNSADTLTAVSGSFEFKQLVSDLIVVVANSSCRVQHREEKQLDASLESLVSRVAHVKNALHSFLFKLENEYERLTW